MTWSRRNIDAPCPHPLRGQFIHQTGEGYAKTDLFAVYAPLPWLSMQVNINNIADARYVEGPWYYAGFNHFGAPRHVIGMVRMTF